MTSAQNLLQGMQFCLQDSYDFARILWVILACVLGSDCWLCSPNGLEDPHVLSVRIYSNFENYLSQRQQRPIIELILHCHCLTMSRFSTHAFNAVSHVDHLIIIAVLNVIAFRPVHTCTEPRRCSADLKLLHVYMLICVGMSIEKDINLWHFSFLIFLGGLHHL